MKIPTGIFKVFSIFYPVAVMMKVLARRRLALIVLGCLVISAWSSGCARKAVVPVFDMAPLLGRDIEQATRILGTPARDGKDASGQLQRVWVRDGVTLAANWKASSGRVLRWNLLVRQPENALSDGDKSKLLQAARATENNAAYSVEYIEAPERPLFYIGAALIPTPRQHTVLLRVTGSQALLQVTAQPAPAGQEATFITIPTWQTTFAAPDDASLSLSSRIMKNLLPGSPFSMKVEISVDGKIVKSATSSGPPVGVQYEI